jgi:hypothetical protein
VAYREQNGFDVSEGFGGQPWDTYARGVIEDQNGAMLLNPPRGFASDNGIPAAEFQVFQDQIGEIQQRYENERQNSSLSPKAQLEYVNEQLEAFENLSTEGLRQEDQITMEQAKNFLEGEKKVLEEMSLPEPSDAREAPQDIPEGAGDGEGFDGGTAESQPAPPDLADPMDAPPPVAIPVVAAPGTPPAASSTPISIEIEDLPGGGDLPDSFDGEAQADPGNSPPPPPENMAPSGGTPLPGLRDPVSPNGSFDVDLPEGFDNVGAFELL